MSASICEPAVVSTHVEGGPANQNLCHVPPMVGLQSATPALGGPGDRGLLCLGGR